MGRCMSDRMRPCDGLASWYTPMPHYTRCHAQDAMHAGLVFIREGQKEGERKRESLRFLGDEKVSMKEKRQRFKHGRCSFER